MHELLRIAVDESQAQPWPRVHALNTLRLAFGDKTLANDASGFFAQGALPLTPDTSPLFLLFLFLPPNAFLIFTSNTVDMPLQLHLCSIQGNAAF